MTSSPIVFVGIAPHPPIMVPEVGGEMITEVSKSIEAMRVFAERVVESGAATVVFISPHAPLEANSFVAYADPELRGDFANFRAPQATVAAENDASLLDAIAAEAARDGYDITLVEDYKLDHGTAVPLYFLRRHGFRGRVVALGYSFLPDEDHTRFGASVRRALEAEGRPAAFVASGDLSHRLKPGAPAGYNPDAHYFDEEVVEAVRTGSPERIAGIDRNLRKLAGECGYRSMLVALGLSRGLAPACEVLNYEAPFGVGYLVAQIAAGKTEARHED